MDIRDKRIAILSPVGSVRRLVRITGRNAMA